LKYADTNAAKTFEKRVEDSRNKKYNSTFGQGICLERGKRGRLSSTLMQLGASELLKNMLESRPKTWIMSMYTANKVVY